MANVLGFLQKVAPWVTAAATCNIPALVGLAAQTVATHTGKDVQPTVDSIAAAVAGATPEQILALKQADADLQVKLQSMGFEAVTDLASIAEKDRESARTMQEIVRSWMPAFISCGVMIMAGFVVWKVFEGRGEILKDATISLTVGTVIGYVFRELAEVCAFYLGSSSGSLDKNATIEKLALAQNGNSKGA